LLIFLLCESFQPRACSLPPEPTTKTSVNSQSVLIGYIIQDWF
jgi:hypothetical protein